MDEERNHPGLIVKYWIIRNEPAEYHVREKGEGRKDVNREGSEKKVRWRKEER